MKSVKCIIWKYLFYTRKISDWIEQKVFEFNLNWHKHVSRKFNFCSLRFLLTTATLSSLSYILMEKGVVIVKIVVYDPLVIHLGYLHPNMTVLSLYQKGTKCNWFVLLIVLMGQKIIPDSIEWKYLSLIWGQNVHFYFFICKSEREFNSVRPPTYLPSFVKISILNMIGKKESIPSKFLTTFRGCV